MLTEDYLMRMINLAVTALLQAIGLRKEGKYSEARQAINQALEQLTGLRADLLERLDDQALLESLTVQGEFDHERSLLLADLYQEQGEIDQAQGYLDQACASRGRALALLLEASFSPSLETAQQEKIEQLVRLTEACALPFETCFTLYSYYESHGDYNRAEQALGSLRSDPRYGGEMRQEYREFCLRLLEKSEPELELGGLTHSQVEEWARLNG
jgi:hypothetical protein